MSISGTADGLIPYEGGTSAVFGGDNNFYFMSCDESNQEWALHNNCDIVPVVSTVSASLGDGTADYYQYLNCDSGVYVEHYKVYGAGHNAGGTDLDGKSSDEIAYDFILKVEGGINLPTASPIKCHHPTSSPTLAPIAIECTNDNTWHGKFNDAHTCDYIANDPNIRCNWENDKGVKAIDACPVACDTCPDEGTPTPPTTAPTPVPSSTLAPTKTSTPGPSSVPTLAPNNNVDCADDDTWHGKFNIAHTCDYVADMPEIRCNWVNDQSVPANEACPVSCNTCNS